MFKKILITIVCLASMLLTTRSFALDKALSARSGEIICIGGHGTFSGSKLVTNFVFRNIDPANAISFTKVRLYTEDGILVASLVPGNFLASFKEVIGPFGTAAISSTDLLAINGISGGRLTLRVNYETSNGASALAPHAMSGQIESALDGTLISRDTVDCIYSNLSNKAIFAHPLEKVKISNDKY